MHNNALLLCSIFGTNAAEPRQISIYIARKTKARYGSFARLCWLRFFDILSAAGYNTFLLMIAATAFFILMIAAGGLSPFSIKHNGS